MKTLVQKTSLIAFDEIQPKLGIRQLEVLNAFKQKENFTNYELADFLQRPINTITPRVHELRKFGLVKEHSRRPCKVTGRIAISWEIAPGKVGEQMSLI
jgi:predicted transcriptional regulator